MQIVRRADAHQIARPLRRQMRDARLDHGQHHLLRLADGEAAERIAVEAHVDQRLGARAAQRRACAALDDAEERMAGLRAERDLASLRPAQRKPHGALDLGLRRRQLHTFVELHLDVGAEQALDLHRALRRQMMPRAVDMGLKGHAAFVELAQLRERHDLKAAGIGEDRPWPVHELMQAAERGDALGARPQHQMIGVGEHDIGAERMDILRDTSP